MSYRRLIIIGTLIVIQLKLIVSFNEKQFNYNFQSIQQKIITNPLFVPIQHILEKQDEFTIVYQQKTNKLKIAKRYRFQLLTLVLLMLPMRIIYQIQSLKYHIFAIISSVILYGMKRDAMQSAFMNAYDRFKAFRMQLISKSIVETIVKENEALIDIPTYNDKTSTISVNDVTLHILTTTENTNELLNLSIMDSSVKTEVGTDSFVTSEITSEVESMTIFPTTVASQDDLLLMTTNDTLTTTDDTLLLNNNIEIQSTNEDENDQEENNAVMQIVTGAVAGTVVGGPMGAMVGAAVAAGIVQQEMRKQNKGWTLRNLANKLKKSNL